MFKKISIGIGIFLFLLLGAAITLPIIFKNDIIVKVKSLINDNLTAKVEFGDFSISVLRSFPNLSFSIENLSVAGTDSFVNDTLANIKEFYVVVDIMSVIKGDAIKIKSIRIDQPNIYVKVLPSGRANWDIMKPDTTTVEVSIDTTESGFVMALQKYEIRNGHIVYDDQSLEFYTELNGMNHKGSGDFTLDVFTLLTETLADELTVSYGGIPYLSKVKAELKIPIEMDLTNMKFTFTQNELVLNDLMIDFEGFVAMPDTNIDMDLKFDAEKSDFKKFLSLIPAMYASDFSSLQAEGNFAMKGFLKGTYNAVSMPGFGMDALIENGNFKYPDLPGGVNNVQMNLSIQNPTGDMDHTVVDLSKLHIEFAQEAFDAHFLLKTPISDPDIDMYIKGKIDLAQITNIVPIQDTKISGIIQSDMSAKGKLSTIEKGNYESFDAKGSLSISEFNYATKDVLPLSIAQAIFSFSPRNITLSNLDARFGKSDFKANGTLDNYLAFALRDEALKGKLILRSSLIDVNEMMGSSTDEEQGSTDTSEMTVIEIPANIDFVFSSSIEKVLYDNMEIEQLAGSIVIHNQSLSFDKVSLNTLDGKVTMDGSYNTQNITEPRVDMQFAIQNMNIQKAFKTFNTIQKLAPVAERTSGTFNTTLAFKSVLGKDMTPVMNSIQGNGLLSLNDASVSGSNLLVKLADAVKIDDLKQLSLRDVKIQFKIEDGRLIVNPFDIKTKLLSMNIAGSSGLDQSLDYVIKMDLPKGSIGTAANNVIGGLIDKMNTQGANYDGANLLKVNALVGGTSSDPTLKLDMADVKSGLTDAARNVLETKKTEAVNKVKEEAGKKAEEILAAAQAQADRVKAEARNLAEKTRKEGYAAADKLEKEATNPVAKTIAKKAADKLRKETDEKAQQIIAEGDRKADEIMAKARTEASRLN